MPTPKAIRYVTLHFIGFIKKTALQSKVWARGVGGRGGEGYLGYFLLGICRYPLRTTTPL